MPRFFRADEIKPGMRVRKRGTAAGRNWYTVKTVDKINGDIAISGNWVAGAKFAFLVPADTEFVGGFMESEPSKP